MSSPGADRILEKEREFLYYTGRKVDVKLYKAIGGLKEFSGILEGFEDNTAKINIGNETVEVPKSDAVWIRLSFEF